jgi:AAA15 family ATPase/GTPase
LTNKNKNMIYSLKVHNYRNLVDLKINSLSQINLITGKNNTGKSTLLEAITLLVSKGDIKNILQILLERGEHFRFSEDYKTTESSVKSLSSLFNDRIISFDNNDFIEISSSNNEKNNPNNVKFSLVKYINEDDENLIVRKKVITNFDEDDTNIKIGFKIEANNQTQIYTLTDGLDRFVNRIGFKNTDYTDIIKYVKTKNINKDTNSKLWDSIDLTPKEKYVIDALKIIEPRTEGITFKQVNREDRNPFIKLSNDNLIIPLESMGDGINRILTIILSLVNSENGYFLIDEIENGLHHSVQEKLWEIIFNLSEKLNIQVFATTHSEDTIKSFENIINSSSNKIEGKLIRLENKNNSIRQIEFDANELKIATDNDIEIR